MLIWVFQKHRSQNSDRTETEMVAPGPAPASLSGTLISEATMALTEREKHWFKEQV